MRRTHAFLPALLLFALIGAAACTDVAEPKPLQVTITAEPTTAAVGDTIAFETLAQGFEIIEIAVELGDGENVSFDYPAFTSASANFTHVYEEPGTYTVTATVLDLRGDERTDEVTLTIQ